MPYKNKICGVYVIETPRGSKYVGSSTNIHTRWSGHRYALRKRTHHSTRLQAAYDKYGDRLSYYIVKTCSQDDLNDAEQEAINNIKPVLNTTQFVNNVWANEETREKFRKIHTSKEWREKYRRIGSTPNARWVEVEDSLGNSYRSMAEAARAYGVFTALIKLLAETQTISGRLGVRFRKVGEPWTEPKTQHQKSSETRTGMKHTDEAKKKMSIASKRRGAPGVVAWKKSIEANSVKVVGTSLADGSTVEFSSMRAAARHVSPERYRTAGAQISKVCSGVKKSAYGYAWAKSRA